MPVIAIMTDFGMKDGNVGVMKGVIRGICPDASIVDVSHLIGPQNVREAALILARSAPYFPNGTIQLVVVDPGVGTSRRPMAARVGNQYYVGPDNGTITLWLERARGEGVSVEFVHLDQSSFWLPEVSNVFHGRDIFAPVAAHLARGVDLRALGTQIHDPVAIEFPKPRRTADGWEGQVIYIDHFGNIASNVRKEHLGESLNAKHEIRIRLANTTVYGLVDAFGEATPGEAVALLGSTGNLIVSVVNGNAASDLGIGIGETLEVILPKGRVSHVSE